MLILSVDLENAKSFERAHVEFKPGVNAIVGHNGAGKSTILEAIGFALFDKLDYKQNEFVRAGMKTATITVRFASSADERAYDVIRRVGSSAAYYVYDPELQSRLCDGKADVTSFLKEHMGVEPGADLTAIFRDAVGVAQGTFTAVFLDTPARRKPIFDALLQVEEYQKAWVQLREPVRLIQKREGEVDVEIAGLSGRLERLPELEQSIVQRRATLEQRTRALAAARSELETLVARRETLEAERQQVSALQSQQIRSLQYLQGVEQRLVALKRELTAAEEAARLVAANQAGHDRYRAAEETRQRLDGEARRRQQLLAAQAEADKELALAASQVEKLRADLEAIEAAERDAETLRPAVEEQTQLEAELAQAQQQQARLTEAERTVAQRQREATTLAAHLATLQKQLARTVEADAERKRQETLLAELRMRLQQEREQEAQVTAEGKGAKTQSEALAQVETALCPVCEQPLTPDHRHRLMTRNDERMAELRAALLTIRKQVQQREGGVKQTEGAVAKLQEELRNLPRAAEAAKVENDLKAVEAALAEDEARLKSLAGAPARIETISSRLKELGDPRRRHAIAAERAMQRAAVEQRIGQGATLIEEKRSRLVELRRGLDEFVALDEQVEAVQAALRENADAYQIVLGNRNAAATVAERAAEVAAGEQERKQADVEASAAASQLAAAETHFDAAEYQRVVGDEQRLRGEAGAMAEGIQLLGEAQRKDEAEADELRRMTVTMAAAQKRKAALERQETSLEQIRDTLREAGPHITAALIRRISEGARAIFNEIMQDYSRHLAWNEDYGITLQVDAHERQFGQLSGGEQMSAALSVRLALLREMSNIDVAFFDEPTVNLDEERRESLARQILQVKGFRQIFVISHDDTFQQATQNLIRVERVDGKSRLQPE